MSAIPVSLTRAKAAITIAAVAGVGAVALIAASPAHAVPCTTVGTATGTAGNDTMCGSTGADVMFGLDGDDNMSGVNGNDTLDGSFGDDIVDGGPGNDSLRGGSGSDDFEGGSGNDRLLARDGELEDGFDCGSGFDSLDFDLVDAVFVLSLLFRCETITVGAVNEGPNVAVSRHSVNVGTDGRAAVRLRCPASLTAPCAGTLRIGRNPKTEGRRTQYSIDQGEKEKVSARLSRRDRRRLRRREELTARVTSVEQGQFGDKTTVQTINLTAQD